MVSMAPHGATRARPRQKTLWVMPEHGPGRPRVGAIDGHGSKRGQTKAIENPFLSRTFLVQISLMFFSPFFKLYTGIHREARRERLLRQALKWPQTGDLHHRADHRHYAGALCLSVAVASAAMLARFHLTEKPTTA